MHKRILCMGWLIYSSAYGIEISQLKNDVINLTNQIMMLNDSISILSAVQKSAQQGEEPYIAGTQPLDLVFLLDAGDEGKIKMDDRGKVVLNTKGKAALETAGVYESFRSAVRDKVPFVASRNLLYILTEKAEESSLDDALFSDLDADEWLLFLNSKEDFVIGLPKNYWKMLNFTNISTDLLKIGLNAQELSFITSNDRITIFSQNIQPQPIDVDTIKKLFATHINNKYIPVNKDSRKRIFLTGHGGYPVKNSLSNPTIAQLTGKQYKELLNFLNDVGTDLFYINSCFSAGQNLLEPYKQQINEQGSDSYLNYFIIVGALTDTVAYTVFEKINFRRFFETVDTFFAPKNKPLKNPFAAMAKFVWGEMTLNIPSVRFPGSLNYFKAIDVDNSTEIITYSKSIAHKLEKKPFQINSTIKNILLYPAKIEVPLNFTSINVSIFSMFPGNAVHLIPVLNGLEKFAFNDLITSLFFAEKDISKLATRKVFLIEKMSCKNYKGSGIAEAGDDDTLALEKIVISQGAGNDYSFFKISEEDSWYWGVIKERKFEKWISGNFFDPIKRNEAKDLLKVILKHIVPINPEALKQASGGQEDPIALEQEMKSFIQ